MRLVPALAVAVLGAVSLPAAGQVSVADAWVRATVPGQMATGAFMRVTATADATLTGAASPAARIVEIHEMRMDAGVMKMGAIDKLPLPAGKAVDFRPGGYHVMLMDLPRPLAAGETVPITLTFTDKAGKAQRVEVRAVVRALTAAPGPSKAP